VPTNASHDASEIPAFSCKNHAFLGIFYVTVMVMGGDQLDVGM
jgi:hypothetical protein